MNIPIPPSIYFGGCAFGSAFYVGVYKAMLEVWGADFMDKTMLCGDSAGVIMAVGIGMRHSPDFIGETYQNTGKAAPFGIFVGGLKYLESNCLEKLIEPAEASTKLSGRIAIGCSHFFARHVWRTSWSSRDEILQSMKQSFHVPLLSGVARHNIVDGAFIVSGRDFPHGDETLFVGFDPAADITAPISFKELCFPSLGADYDGMVARGYNAFMEWGGAPPRPKVGIRRGKRTIQAVLWFLKAIEKILCLFQERENTKK